MNTELMFGLYFTLLLPAIWFLVTPYVKNYIAMVAVASLSLTSLVVGTWYLANMIPQSVKVMLSPTHHSSLGFYNATFVVIKNVWYFLILAIPWIIVGIVVVRLVLGFIMLSKRVKGFVPANDRETMLLKSLSAKMNMIPPKLFAGKTKGVAFSTLDSIYLSEEIANVLSDDKLSALLAHELAHIKRNDQISKWSFMIISALSLIVPSSLIKKTYDLNVEIETDKKACEIIESPIILAETLIFCAKHTIPQHGVQNMSSIDQVTVRVRRILEIGTPKPKLSPLRLIPVYILTAVMAFSLAAPVLTETEPSKTFAIDGISEIQMKRLIEGDVLVNVQRDGTDGQITKLSILPPREIDRNNHHDHCVIRDHIRVFRIIKF